jgi:hypothetical protein
LAYSDGVRFEWDASKARRNEQKHGVTFIEARELFESGVDYLEILDSRHEGEERFIALGPIRRGLVLVVWTERDEDVVRIVSARWATPGERHLYRAHLEGLR